MAAFRSPRHFDGDRRDSLPDAEVRRQAEGAAETPSDADADRTWKRLDGASPVPPVPPVPLEQAFFRGQTTSVQGDECFGVKLQESRGEVSGPPGTVSWGAAFSVEGNSPLSAAEFEPLMAEKPLTDWDSNLFDCFEDASTCCYGFWCCPSLACTVSGRFGENYCLPLCDVFSCAALLLCRIPLFVPPATLSLRSAVRNKYGIKGSICKDIFASFCCMWCTWCQMHRELKHRKKAPTVINMQSQTIVNAQPLPLVAVSGGPPAAGFVNQPGVVIAAV